MTVEIIPINKIVTNDHDFLWRDEGLTVMVSELGGEKYASPLGSTTCSRCGEYLRMRFDGDMLVAKTEGPGNSDLNEPCPCPDDLETVTRIEVPSGRLIVDDSLREVYDVSLDGIDYNSAWGQSEAVKRYAEIGCAYGPVGNSCPSVYRTPEGYAIALIMNDEETDEPRTPEGWEEITWVCTDLWAYSIADYQHFLDNGGKPIEEDDQNGTRHVVEVEPGAYEFTLYSGRKDFEPYSGDTIYATFRKA